ncbi:hypothetical protein DH2020_020101 [Rehmannia glutinosa]|uniref:Jacalin-type lectin domain-containing protein n=1 Tax=Rehmannia glutinosa TaxID=99300 RepID=A0ABR0WIZ0_REHGL
MSDDSSIIKIGPVGNKNGDTWDEKGHNKIVQIFVCHDDEINSIQFQYSENGNLVLSERHGTNDGYKFDVSYHNSNLCSLTFGTNHGEYGPFGQFTSHDKEFSFRLGDDRQFGGFHGNADNKTVKSIGVYLKPITTLEYSVNKNNVKLNTKEGESWEMLNGLHD